MKPFLFPVCLALALCLASQTLLPGQALAKKSKAASEKHTSKSQVDKKPGDDPAKQFLGAAWGSATAEMKGLAHVEQAGMVAYLRKDGQDLTYLGVPVVELVAVACRGKLGGGMARLGTDEAYAAMEKALSALKGQPGIEVEGGGRQWEFGDTLAILKKGTTQAPPALTLYHSDAFLPCARAWDAPSYEVFVPSKDTLLEQPSLEPGQTP